MPWLSALGSVASILGFLLTIYVLVRENTIENEVLELTEQEAKRDRQT